MIKGIPRDIHGFADYSYIPVVWMAPTLFNFKEDMKATMICKVISAATLGYCLITDAPWGAAKIISYKTHTAIDITLGAVAVAAPLLFNVSSRQARNTLLLAGVTGLIVGTLSWIGANNSDEDNMLMFA